MAVTAATTRTDVISVQSADTRWKIAPLPLGFGRDKLGFCDTSRWCIAYFMHGEVMMADCISRLEQDDIWISTWPNPRVLARTRNGTVLFCPPPCSAHDRQMLQGAWLWMPGWLAWPRACSTEVPTYNTRRLVVATANAHERVFPFWSSPLLPRYRPGMVCTLAKEAMECRLRTLRNCGRRPRNENPRVGQVRVLRERSAGRTIG
ncbi:hypothetical protein LX32DRAFT_248219 [Colletotrichum zoysiae]|uniref:Uncharacterized protein n=1 Tax=Colletotrichum zoysiae TaxID=1216348 RepID=A0AAD9H4W0_9PEZI|nr:hypothetical protein LX32DRAFT_248219 [Colletotrichum zoysiae]